MPDWFNRYRDACQAVLVRAERERWTLAAFVAASPRVEDFL